MEHFDGTRFFAPGVRLKTLGELLRWQLLGERKRWPARREIPPGPRPAPRVDGPGLTVTLVNHATVLLQVAGLNVLTDPVWAERASPLPFAGPRRVHAPGIAMDDLPPIDIVLISHNHYDHFDSRTLRQLAERHHPLVIAPLGNGDLIARAMGGADARQDRAGQARARQAGARRIVTLDWEQAHEIRPGVRVHCEPALHWSSRGLGDRNKALWSAFSIVTPAGHIYFAGDTGFGDGSHFREVARRHGPPALALLPIGAYEPRWFMAPFHMNPDEAVRAFGLLEARRAIAIHHGCFPLADEGIDEPVEALEAAFVQHGVSRERFRVVRPGSAWTLPSLVDEDTSGGELVSGSAVGCDSC
jgi:L-ascorbate metabolism protein UlaG (beta-lactamase superfamily)